MHNISILIPSYNDICLPLVEKLKAQADAVCGLEYEIVVADDGSTDKEIIKVNRQVAEMEHCRFIEREKNIGRAAIRNFLGKEAKYDWLVFIDCEVEPSASLIANYVNDDSQADVVCGGVAIGGKESNLRNNLRYIYEKSMEPSYSAVQRRKNGFYSFRTTNFMIKKEALIQVPFNENMNTYGYEDVIFGKQLQLAGFKIEHIDNPVSMYKYEDNKRFVEKTEEALKTLHAFSEEIGDYSPILTFISKLRKYHLSGITKYCFKPLNKKLRTNLCGDNPKPLFYKLYKLGYFLNLI